MPSDLPSRELFEVVGWGLAALAVVNLALLVAIVVQREKWVLQGQLRERILRRLAPVVEDILDGEEVERAVEEARSLMFGVRRQARPVAAWLLLDGLREAGPETRDAVRRAFEETGVIESAERATRWRMPWRRALSCEFLGTIGTEASVEVLVPRLQDKRHEVRIAAARALGRLGHPTAAAPLTEIFLSREGIPTGVVHDALLGLGAAGAQAFRKGLDSTDPIVRLTSCFGIAAQGESTPHALALLEERLRDDAEARVRSAAASAMQRLPGEAAPEALLDAHQDPAPAVRRSAARALAAFDNPAAVDALAALSSDPDRETALRAAESLLALSDSLQAGEPARRALIAACGWSVHSARAMAALGA